TGRHPRGGLLHRLAAIARKPGEARRARHQSVTWRGLCPLRAAKPLFQADPPEACFTQRHQRALLDLAAEISGFGVTHYLARVGDPLQIAGDDLVERGPLRTGDLDNAVSRRRERHLSHIGSNVVRRDRLEESRRDPDLVSMRTLVSDAR